MGRLTQEKIQSILAAYDSTPSFAEVANTQHVDERVVRKYVERRRKMVHVDVAQPASAAIASKVGAAAVEQKAVEERRFEEIEALGFELCEQGKMPVDLVIKLKIKGQLANRIYEDYLVSKNKGDVAQILQAIGKNAHRFKDLYDLMEREKMDPGPFVDNLKLVPIVRILKQQHSELENAIQRQRVKVSREALEHKGRMERCKAMEKESVDGLLKAAEKLKKLSGACETGEQEPQIWYEEQMRT